MTTGQVSFQTDSVTRMQTNSYREQVDDFAPTTQPIHLLTRRACIVLRALCVGHDARRNVAGQVRNPTLEEAGNLRDNRFDFRWLEFRENRQTQHLFRREFRLGQAAIRIAQ